MLGGEREGGCRQLAPGPSKKQLKTETNLVFKTVQLQIERGAVSTSCSARQELFIQRWIDTPMRHVNPTVAS